MFWGSFEEKRISLIAYGLWTIVALFWQKFRQVAKLHFTCPQQNFEKKWLKYFSLLSSLLDFQWVFSDFDKKSSQVCWNNNLSVLGKNVKKLCWTICFSSFSDFDKKNLCFCRKVFGRVVKKLSTCPVEHIQINISESKSWELEDFWIIFEVLGTMAENLFQGWQNSNRCPREQFMKFFFQKRKIRYFFRFWANVYFQRKLSPELRNPQSMFPWKFLGKTIFEKYIISHTFFGLWSKKRLVGKKIFSQVVTTAIRTFRGIFREKLIFFKKNLFVHLFWSLSNFSCLLTKNSQGVKETSY